MKTFFNFEKEALREVVVKAPMDFNKMFDDDERAALAASLKYSSGAYLDSSIRYFPNYEKAKRIELTLALTSLADTADILDKLHKIILGRYEIYIDFWFFSGSRTRGLELQYPRWAQILN